jgi:hypothetical protein
MNRYLKTSKWIFLLLSCFCGGAWGFSEDAVVNGASQFMMDRAHQNYLYIYEQRIVNNKLFNEYFPNTIDMIGGLRLQFLLNDKEQLKRCILKDLDSISRMCKKYYDYKVFIVYRDTLLTVLDSLKRYCSKEDTDQVQRYIKAVDSINTISRDTLSDLLVRSFYALSAKSEAAKTMEKKYGFLRHPKLYGKIVNDINASLQAIDDTSYMTTRISVGLGMVQSIIRYEEKIKTLKEKEKLNKKFATLTTICFFFAQIADAKSSEQVKEILKAATIPPVSFGEKRHQGETKLMINAYLGFNAGYELGSPQLDSGSWYQGMNAPVGIEISYGLGWCSSFSILASMVNLGSAVNAQIYQQRTPRIADLFEPGLSFIYGIPHLPLSIGVQGSYGTRLKTNGKMQGHITVFFAFDMPLLMIEPLF